MKNTSLINRSKLDSLFLMMITTVALLFIASPVSVLAQESDAAAAEADSRDPITIINDIRTLLTQANNEYLAQNFTGAATTVQTAYLDHYEYLEGPLAALNPELMEATELLIREDLATAINQRAAVTEVQSLINTVNNNLDQAEVLFQQQ